MTVRVRDHHDASDDLVEFVAGKAERGLAAGAITEEANIAFNQGVLPGLPVSDDGYKRRRYSESLIAELMRTADVQESVGRIRKEREDYAAEVAKGKRDEQLARARLAKQQKREQELVPGLYERLAAVEEALQQHGLLK